MTLAVRSTRRRSRIAHFKAPFVVAVLAPVAPFELGCGARAQELAEPPFGSGGTTQTSATTPTSQSTSNPTPAANGSCPAERPILGSACSGNPSSGADGAGAGCKYEPLPACVESIACVDGSWRYSNTGGGCNPPWAFGLDTCPTTPPAMGTSCENAKPGVTCNYAYCGGLVPMARCSEQTVLWETIPVPTCNPPYPGGMCPELMPVHGSDCFDEGQVCGYDGCTGPGTDTAACSFGQWSVQYIPGPACNPPAALTPVCPSAEPAAGNGCAFEGQACPYGTCGSVQDPGRTATCSSGTWQLLEVPCFSSSDAGVDGGG